MRALAIRLGVTAFGLWVASSIVPGMRIEGLGTFVLAAFLLGIANAIVRPVLVFLTLPLTILTLGLFLLVINAAMLGLVAALLQDFHLSGFLAALFGWVVLTVASGLASWLLESREPDAEWF
jgi:putative membrane protein